MGRQDRKAAKTPSARNLIKLDPPIVLAGRALAAYREKLIAMYPGDLERNYAAHILFQLGSDRETAERIYRQLGEYLSNYHGGERGVLLEFRRELDA